MSTILRALRRLEEEKTEQATRERLHGEIVAPQSPGDAGRRPPVWVVVLGAVVLLAVVGAGVYGVLRTLGDDGGGDGRVAEAAAPAAADGATSSDGATTRSGTAAAVQRRTPASAEDRAARRAERQARRAERIARQQAAAAQAADPALASATTPPDPTEAQLRAQAQRQAREEVQAQRRARGIAPPPTAAARTLADAAPPSAGASPGETSGRPIESFPVQEEETFAISEPAESALPVVAAARAMPSPVAPATSSADAAGDASAAPAPPQSAASWRTTPPGGATGDRTAYGAQRDFAVVVERTVWHPQLDRRFAHVRVTETGQVAVVREGDVVAGLRIDEIGLSDVVFHGADGPVRRRVGAAR